MFTRQSPREQIIKVILQVIFKDDWQTAIPSPGEVIELLETLEAAPSMELAARIEGVSPGKRQGIYGAILLARATHPELFN